MTQEGQDLVHPPQASILLQQETLWADSCPVLMCRWLLVIQVGMLLLVQLMRWGVAAVGWQHRGLQVLLPGLSCCWICGSELLQVQLG